MRERAAFGEQRQARPRTAHHAWHIEQFDKLAGIHPVKRSRDDRLPVSLLTTLDKWLADSGADELAKWSHVYLAHAGDPESRMKKAAMKVTTNKITDAIKARAQVTEAGGGVLGISTGSTGVTGISTSSSRGVYAESATGNCFKTASSDASTASSDASTASSSSAASRPVTKKLPEPTFQCYPLQPQGSG